MNPDEQLRVIIETIPASICSARPDGSAEFSRRWLDDAGLSYEEVRDWAWSSYFGRRKNFFDRERLRRPVA